MNTRKPPQLPAIFGLDPSLNGTALWKYGEDHGIKLDIEELTGLARLIRLRELLYNTLIQNEDVSVVVVEGYSFGSASRAHGLGEWGGILRMACIDYLPKLTTIIEVAPQTLKKYVIGHAKPGTSGKQIMILKTYKRWGIEIEDDDLCDAHGLARAGAVLMRGEGTETDLATLSKAQVTRL